MYGFEEKERLSAPRWKLASALRVNKKCDLEKQ